MRTAAVEPPSDDPGRRPAEGRVLTVISDRDLAGKVIISRFSAGPLLRGPRTDRFWCGHCGEVVLDGADLEALGGVVLRCNCGAYNVAPHR